MQSQIGGTVALIVAASLLSIFGLGALMAFLCDRKRSREDEAAITWADIRLRNGVTAPSPWHAPNAPINAPGLVEVAPGQLSLPIHPWELDSESSIMQGVENCEGIGDSGDSQLVNEPELQPMEFTGEASQGERAIVQRLIRKGFSQNRVIVKVWGIKPGGSAKYKAARELFNQYKKEMSENA